MVFRPNRYFNSKIIKRLKKYSSFVSLLPTSVLNLIPSTSKCFSDSGSTTQCTNGDPIYNWISSEGQSHVFSQATLSSRPLFNVNSASSISYYVVTEGTDGTQEIQEFYFTKTLTGGHYIITINGHSSGNIAYNASTETIKAAIEGITGIGSGNVYSVTGNGTQSSHYTVTFSSSLGNISQMTIDDSNLSATASSYDFLSNSYVDGEAGVTSHVWTLTFDTRVTGNVELSIHDTSVATVASNVDSSGLASALLIVWPSNYLSGGGSSSTVTINGDIVTWHIEIDSSNVPTEASHTATENFSQGSFSTTISTTQGGATGVTEVQVVTLSSGPTQGTFKLFTSGNALNYNATSSEVQNEINTTLSINTSVSKSGYQYTITWPSAGSVSNTILQPTNISLAHSMGPTSGLQNNVHFDGVNDSLTGPAAAIWNDSGPCSFSFWYFGKSVSTQHTIRLKGSTEFVFLISNGNNGGLLDRTIYFGFRSQKSHGTTSSTADIDNIQNVWTHFVMTYSGGNKDLTNSFKVYVNSNLVTLDGNTSSGIGGASNQNAIGCDSGGGSPMGGRITGFKVFNSELSQSQVNELYAA